jgi:hypothetical protein
MRKLVRLKNAVRASEPVNDITVVLANGRIPDFIGFIGWAKLQTDGVGQARRKKEYGVGRRQTHHVCGEPRSITEEPMNSTVHNSILGDCLAD